MQNAAALYASKTRALVVRRTAIVVVGHNSADWLRGSVGAISTDCWRTKFRLIYVDNASTDRSVSFVRNLDDVHVVSNEVNRGFGAACNQGAWLAAFLGCDVVIFVNPDVSAAGSVLVQLADVVRNDPGIGVAGPLQRDLLSDDHHINAWTRRAVRTASIDPVWHNRCLPFSSDEFSEYLRDASATIDVSYVNGACLAMCLDTFWRLGGFSPAYFLFFEEVDLCRRVRNLGIRVTLVRDLEVAHAWGGHESGRRLIEWKRSRLMFVLTDVDREVTSGLRLRRLWSVLAADVVAASQSGPHHLVAAIRALLGISLRRVRAGRAINAAASGYGLRTRHEAEVRPATITR